MPIILIAVSKCVDKIADRYIQYHYSNQRKDNTDVMSSMLLGNLFSYQNSKRIVMLSELILSGMNCYRLTYSDKVMGVFIALCTGRKPQMQETINNQQKILQIIQLGISQV